jgi:hypothetical protein
VSRYEVGLLGDEVSDTGLMAERIMCSASAR